MNSPIAADFNAIVDLRARKETVLNYALVATLGTCGMVVLQSVLSTPSPLLGVGVSIGLAAVVDAQLERMKTAKKTIHSQTQFVKQYGNEYEAIWAKDLADQEHGAVKKYRMMTAGVVAAAIGGFVVALPYAPHFKGVLMTAVVALSFIVHKKATKNSDRHMEDATRQRQMLVDQIYHRRTCVAEPASNTVAPQAKI